MRKILFLTVLFFMAGMAAAMAAFIDNGDGTVTENTTDLMWQQQTGSSMTFSAAQIYCDNLTLAGHTDWRLPDLSELQSLVDDTKTNPAIDTAFFPGSQSTEYWSSTAHFFVTYMWVLDFGIGEAHFVEKTNNSYIRAVRDIAQAPPAQTWYQDADKDGFGDSSVSQQAATKPLGYVLDSKDCDDSDPDIYPGAPEIAADGIDQDCDGSDASSDFSGILTSDVNGGLAPVIVQFNTFVAQGLAPFVYDYDFGDGSTITNGGKKQSHTFKKAGTFTITATVTDAANVIYKLKKSIFVSDTAQINSLLANLQTNADLMGQASGADIMVGLLNDSGNIIQKILKAISNAVTTVKTQVHASIQSKVESLVTNTGAVLNTLIQNSKITAVDIINISAGLKKVVSEMIKNGVPVTDKTLTEMEAISGIIYAQTLDSLLQNSGLTQAEIDELKSDHAKARAFFLKNPHLLTGLTNSTGIPVETVSEFDADKVEGLAGAHGLTEQQTGILFNAVEKTIDTSQKISSAAGVSTQTIAEIAAEIFSTYYGKTVIKTTIEDITQNLLLQFSDNTYVSFIVESVKVVEAFIPKGLFDLPNGNKLGVTDTYALEFVSYPVFPFGFSAEVIKMGLNPFLTQDGKLQVQLNQLLSLSLKMGWDYFSSIALSSLTTAFSVTGGTDPAAETYAILVTYDTGQSQLMPPSVMAMDALTAWLDTVVPGNYNIDANTGVITVDILKFKPDYIFEALSSIDYTAIKASGGFQEGNLAFGTGDFNGDGAYDLKFYSDNPMGAQIMYAVP